MHLRTALTLVCRLETEAFESNTITTAWLDTLISARLTAERPDQTLAVVCGAATKAHLLAESCNAEFMAILEKGQVPPKSLLQTVFTIDFIYESELMAVFLLILWLMADSICLQMSSIRSPPLVLRRHFGLSS